MSSDWSLVEYRPGRYVKVTPSGDFLGRASRTEVRDWFESQREGRNPQTPPEKPDALAVLEDAFTLFSPAGAQTREAEPPEDEQDALGVLEQALSVFSPVGQGSSESEPPVAEPNAMGILEDAYSLVTPVTESVQPEVAEKHSGAELGPLAPQPVPPGQDPEEPQVEPRLQDAVHLPTPDAAHLDPDTQAIQTDESEEPELPEPKTPRLDVEVEESQAEESKAPQAAMPEPAEPEADLREAEAGVKWAGELNESQTAASPSRSLDLEVGTIEIEEPPVPQEAEPELAALDPYTDQHEPEPPHEASETVPETLSADLDDSDYAEIEEETLYSSLEAEIEHLDPDPDDLLEEELPASPSEKGPGPSRRLAAPDTDQAPPPENHVLDSEALDNGVGRWLWVDPRHEVGYRPAGFDLAGFLQRAVDLFQSKAWTGGQLPGRLAVHPDEAGDDLQRAAKELELEIVPNLQVSLGTYRLALAEPPADAKS